MKAWLTRDKSGELVLWMDYGGGRPAKLPKNEDKNEGWMGVDGLISLPGNHPIGENVNWKDGPVQAIVLTEDEYKHEHTRTKNKLDVALEELVKERRKYAFLRVDLSCLECLEQFKQGVCGLCYAKLALKVKELEEESSAQLPLI
jgi:hypothetical protein